MLFVLEQGRCDNKQKSVVFKNAQPAYHFVIPRNDEIMSNLLDGFTLLQKANAGEPLAQHELGLRYLLGAGFTADTTKAALWIKRAAAQNLISAKYNFGILLNNGWGVQWDPFEAYRQFRYAAVHGMTEARYVLGLMLTDNLIVPQNYAESYHWLSAAADSGYKPARDVLAEFHKKGIDTQVRSDSMKSTRHVSKRTGSDSTRTGRRTPTLTTPDYDPGADSAQHGNLDDQTILQDALLESNISAKDSPMVGTDARTRSLQYAADAGSPEALTLFGRWSELGYRQPEDDITATVFYLNAVRFDSPVAAELLWKLINKKGYFQHLKHRVDGGDAAAEFSWAGLVAFGFDDKITSQQALTFLRSAASKGYLSAVVELGMCYYDGLWLEKDREQARRLFEQAAAHGSYEARMRLTMLELKEKKSSVGDTAIVFIRQASNDGSVLAQTILGYCYETGLGVPTDTPQAVKLYRKAAHRGSRMAYDELRQMYDALRPGNPEFHIPE